MTIFHGRPYLFMIRLRSFSAAALSRFAVTTASKTSPSWVDSAPEIAELAVDLHERLIQMPPPLRVPAHVRYPPLSDLSANIGPNRFHQNRTVSWLMSIPRSAKRSSTLRSDSGYLTYIITTRRITSGELLKHRNGLLMALGYHSRPRPEKLV